VERVVRVNGLPLGLTGLKNAADEHADIWAAFNQIQTYKQQIPSLFVYNAVLIISDGTEARIGTISAALRRLKEDQDVRLPQAPKTLEELETLLLQSIDRLDRGDGVDGEEVYRRHRKRIKRLGEAEIRLPRAD
jgi:type I restriction enzyme R subunit